MKNQLKTLASLKTQIAKIEASVAATTAKVQAQLRKLPAKFGYATVTEFVDAVKLAFKDETKPARKGKSAKASTGTVRKGRVSLTPAVRQEVKDFLATGKSTIEAAAKFSISVPTAQNLKKEAGLVRQRKTADAAPVAAVVAATDLPPAPVQA